MSSSHSPNSPFISHSNTNAQFLPATNMKPPRVLTSPLPHPTPPHSSPTHPSTTSPLSPPSPPPPPLHPPPLSSSSPAPSPSHSTSSTPSSLFPSLPSPHSLHLLQFHQLLLFLSTDENAHNSNDISFPISPSSSPHLHSTTYPHTSSSFLSSNSLSSLPHPPSPSLLSLLTSSNSSITLFSPHSQPPSSSLPSPPPPPPPPLPQPPQPPTSSALYKPTLPPPNCIIHLPHTHCRSQPPIISFSAQVYQPHAPIFKVTPQNPTTPRQTQPSPPKILLSHSLLHKPTGHPTNVQYQHTSSYPTPSWPTSNATTSIASLSLSQHTSVPRENSSPLPTITNTVNSSASTHISTPTSLSSSPSSSSSSPTSSLIASTASPNNLLPLSEVKETHPPSSIINTIKTTPHQPTSDPATRKHRHCPSCHRTFSRPSLLARHLRVHSREKPFGCQYCRKCFPTKSSCTTHQRLHTGEKPFVCHVCGHKFTASSNLINHHKRKHPLTSPPPPPPPSSTTTSHSHIPTPSQLLPTAPPTPSPTTTQLTQTLQQFSPPPPPPSPPTTLPPPSSANLPPPRFTPTTRPPQPTQLHFICMRCHRAFIAERAWRLHLQLPHPAPQFVSPPAPTPSHGMAFAAPTLTTSTPINSSTSSFHTPTRSTPLHFPTLSHFILNSPNPHTPPPSPPPSSHPHPPTPPPSPPLPHSCTNADADGAATAMARSSLLTATSNLNYTTSTVKTIEPANNSTTNIFSTASNLTSNSNSIGAQPTLHLEN
nr:zinc finger protein [Hymenolepis microstoma]